MDLKLLYSEIVLGTNVPTMKDDGDENATNHMVQLRCGVCFKFWVDYKQYSYCTGCSLIHYTCDECRAASTQCRLESDGRCFNTSTLKIYFDVLSDVEPAILIIKKALDSFVEIACELKRQEARDETNVLILKDTRIEVVKSVDKKTFKNFKKFSVINPNKSMFLYKNFKDSILNMFPHTTKDYIDYLDSFLEYKSPPPLFAKPVDESASYLYLPPTKILFNFATVSAGGPIVLPINRSIVCVSNEDSITQTIDFASLYPSSISRFYLYDAHTCCQPHLKFYNFEHKYVNSNDDNQFFTMQIALKTAGVFISTFCKFYKGSESNTSSEFSKLLTLRISIKHKDPNLATAIKLLLNSAYGSSIAQKNPKNEALKTPMYPNYNMFVGGSVLGAEHISLIRIYSLVAFGGGKVFGGDTDSVHFEICKKHSNIWEKYNSLSVNSKILKLEQENIWTCMLFFVMKKYCGWSLKNGLMGVKCVGLTSSNMSKFTKKLVHNFLAQTITFYTKHQHLTMEILIDLLFTFLSSEIKKMGPKMSNYTDFINQDLQDFVMFIKKKKSAYDHNYSADFVLQQLISLQKTNPATVKPKFVIKFVKLNKCIPKCLNKILNSDESNDYGTNISNTKIVCNYMSNQDFVLLSNKFDLKIDVLYYFTQALGQKLINLLTTNCILTTATFNNLYNLLELSVQTFQQPFFNNLEIKSMFFTTNVLNFELNDSAVIGRIDDLKNTHIFYLDTELEQLKQESKDIIAVLKYRHLNFIAHKIFPDKKQKFDWNMYNCSSHWKNYITIQNYIKQITKL